MCVNYCQGNIWQVENVMNTDGHMTTHEGVALESHFWEILENILTFKGDESSLVYYILGIIVVVYVFIVRIMYYIYTYKLNCKLIAMGYYICIRKWNYGC